MRPIFLILAMTYLFMSACRRDPSVVVPEAPAEDLTPVEEEPTPAPALSETVSVAPGSPVLAPPPLPLPVTDPVTPETSEK